MTEKRFSIRRHAALLGAIIFCFVALFFVGFMLVHSLNDGAIAETLPKSNHPYFLAWRGVLYAAVLLLWKPLLHYGEKKFGSDNQRMNYLSSPKFRARILGMIVLYEVFIVQNSLAYVIEGLRSWV